MPLSVWLPFWLLGGVSGNGSEPAVAGVARVVPPGWQPGGTVGWGGVGPGGIGLVVAACVGVVGRLG